MTADDSSNNFPAGYVPPAVWTWDQPSGGRFASINRPVSGATHQQEMPRGRHDLQLYSLATPNGVKVTICLEELLELGVTAADYDAWPIRIHEGEQFASGFVGINPNSKIPAMLDHSQTPPVALFESGSILVYLAEKFGHFLPDSGAGRAETFNWVMWQVGSAPYVGGGFGHFYNYAPMKIAYAINRYAMETKRQLHVLDTHLATRSFMAAGQYTIADMAIWPWYGGIVRGAIYGAGEFLSVHDYPHLLRWAEQIAERPAVKRGAMVNRLSGPLDEQLHERHEATDFQNNLQSMIEARGGKRI